MSIHESLSRVQHELKAPKNQINTFGNYKYRNQEDILEALKPLLLKHNINLTITDEIILIGDRYYIKATCFIRAGNIIDHIVTHGYAREPLDKKGMDASQITGAASSYARKYALNGMFLIDDTKDADSHEPPAEKAKPAEPKKPTKKAMTSVIYNAMVEAISLGQADAVERKMNDYDIPLENFDNLTNLIKEWRSK